MKNKNVVYAILVGSIIAIVGISVAYAALSSDLDVSFEQVTSGGASWDIGFDTTGSKTGTASNAYGSADGIVCGSATISKNSFTIGATTLLKPGDKCTWETTIKNTGGIDGKISNIALTKPKDATNIEISCTESTNQLVCGNVTYKVTGTQLTSGSVIAKNSGTIPVTITAEYTGSDVSAEAQIQKGAKFTYTFVQK